MYTWGLGTDGQLGLAPPPYESLQLSYADKTEGKPLKDYERDKLGFQGSDDDDSSDDDLSSDEEKSGRAANAARPSTAATALTDTGQSVIGGHRTPYCWTAPTRVILPDTSKQAAADDAGATKEDKAKAAKRKERRKLEGGYGSDSSDSDGDDRPPIEGIRCDFVAAGQFHSFAMVTKPNKKIEKRITSAKVSLDGYRAKLGRLDDQIEDAEEAVRDALEEADTRAATKKRSVLQTMRKDVQRTIARIDADLKRDTAASNAIFAFGRNGNGQLGLGDTDDRREPTLLAPEPFEGFRVTTIACGGNHVLARSQHGEVFAWGKNHRGQLGLGDTDDRPLPTRLKCLHPRMKSGDCFKVLDVAAGTSHSLCLAEWGASIGGKKERCCYSWGCGDHGRLGLSGRSRDGIVGFKQEFTYPDASAPTEIEFLREGRNLKTKVTGGGNRSKGPGALSEADRAAAKRNAKKRGRTQSKKDAQKNKQRAVLQITCGGQHSIVSTERGLYVWGNNRYGQLGLADVYDRDTPELLAELPAGRGFKDIQAGTRHSAVIDDLGQVHFFGRQLSECCSIMMRPKPVLGLDGRSVIAESLACGNRHVLARARIDWDRILDRRDINSAVNLYYCYQDKAPPVTPAPFYVNRTCSSCKIENLCPSCAEVCHGKHSVHAMLTPFPKEKTLYPCPCGTMIGWCKCKKSGVEEDAKAKAAAAKKKKKKKASNDEEGTGDGNDSGSDDSDGDGDEFRELTRAEKEYKRRVQWKKDQMASYKAGRELDIKRRMNLRIMATLYKPGQ